jgi:MerR family transcriptional regulator/heat shock protein HspR
MKYNKLRVGKSREEMMEQTDGVYIMRVASMLTGMHPQTLRKYERVGLLEPSRCKKLRMYSDEDISRLKIIKHLVDDLGLNIAGVRIALKVHETVLIIKDQLRSVDLSPSRRKQLLKSLDDSLSIFGTMLGQESQEFDLVSANMNKHKN